jgi:hypothetical protein
MMKYTLEEAFEAIDSLQAMEGAALSDHLIKLQEEVGEIAEGYLMMTGYKKSKNGGPDAERIHMIEETVDAMIVLLAILSASKAKKSFVEHMLKSKIEKWELAFSKKQEDHSINIVDTQ